MSTCLSHPPNVGAKRASTCPQIFLSEPTIPCHSTGHVAGDQQLFVDSRSSNSEVSSGLMAHEVLSQCLVRASHPGRASYIILVYFIDLETEV